MDDGAERAMVTTQGTHDALIVLCVVLVQRVSYSPFQKKNYFDVCIHFCLPSPCRPQRVGKPALHFALFTPPYIHEAGDLKFVSPDSAVDPTYLYTHQRSRTRTHTSQKETRPS